MLGSENKFNLIFKFYSFPAQNYIITIYCRLKLIVFI
jgi:hypothetical protein